MSRELAVEELAKRIETYHWDVADKPVAAKFAAELRSLTKQPAAVDGAMVERAIAEWKRLEGHQTDAVRMSAALKEALAAQPGGSDND